MTMVRTRAMLYAKIETTYGTDPTPVAATNAILVADPEIEVVAKKLERKNVVSYYGALSKIMAGEAIKIKFKTELKGYGSAGTAPEIGPLFRACNMTEVVSGGVSVTYTPNSNASTGESVTLYFWRHNLLHKVVGCRGAFDIDLKSGEYGMVSWEFTGIYAGPLDSPIPTGTFNATLPARFVSASFAIDSFAAVIETLKIKVANEIARRPSANASTGILEYFVKGRTVTGETDPETPDAMNSGAINVLATAPTAGGSGYSVGNILTITTGGTGATARVTSVSTGAVTAVELVTRGSGYTTGTGKVTTVSPAGGTGCTLNITSIYTTQAKDFWTMWSGSSRVALTAALSGGAGNICTITAPKVQLDEVKYGDREGILTYAVPLIFTPNAGNDELVLTFT